MSWISAIVHSITITVLVYPNQFLTIHSTAALSTIFPCLLPGYLPIVQSTASSQYIAFEYLTNMACWQDSNILILGPFFFSCLVAPCSHLLLFLPFFQSHSAAAQLSISKIKKRKCTTLEKSKKIILDHWLLGKLFWGEENANIKMR